MEDVGEFAAKSGWHGLCVRACKVTESKTSRGESGIAMNEERKETMANERTKMTLARALKEKERIARRLAKAKEAFASINCVRTDEEREIDAKEAYEEMRSLQQRYVAIKKAIAVANAGISPTLVEMLAVRAELAFYMNLRCKTSEICDEWVKSADRGEVRQRVRIEYDTFLNEKSRREMMDKLTQRLDDLQDEVDQFNATHFVELVE